VAAVLLDDEVTLKHIHPHKDGLELRPANQEMESIIISSDQEPPRILGIMVGLLRKN
jgi:repressor LexA